VGLACGWAVELGRGAARGGARASRVPRGE
jgi:hypothetical protein